MKILILGASSYVGARLYLDLKRDHEVVGTYATHKLSDDFIQLDITDKAAVADLIATMAPAVIVHAANNASGKWCAAHPLEAVEVNQYSTGYIVEAAMKAESKLIYISSFAALVDGVYGETKRGSEEIIKGNGIEYSILRPSLIVGFSPNTTNDRPFNRMLKNIDEKTPAAYDSSWKIQPTSLGHLSRVVNYIIDKNAYGSTLHVACPEIVTRYEIARDVLGVFSIEVKEIDIQDPTPPAIHSVADLAEFGFPLCTYSELVTEVIEEIKNRKHFIL